MGKQLAPTSEQVEQYLENGGTRCPFCGSVEIEGTEVNIDAGTASQKMSCADCGATWTDTYKLVGILEEELGPKTRIWLRLGLASEYESFGSIDEAAAECAVFREIGRGVDSWCFGGFQAGSLRGFNYISLYWGDEDAQKGRDLTTAERQEFEERLAHHAKEYGGDGHVL